MKNFNSANINTDVKGLMRYWLDFTEPFHKLTHQQKSILSLLLYYYFEYKKEISNEALVWKMVFDYDTKAKIKEELKDMPDYTLQNNLTALRKKNIIKNNIINKAYVPNYDMSKEKYAIILNFKVTNE